jgi:hypothetical protein
MVRLLSLFAALSLATHCLARNPPTENPATGRKTQNVIVVMIDGMRWQEIFSGADPKLINKHGPRLLGSWARRNSQARELYILDTPKARREALMPFLWSVVSARGQIFGNRSIGSKSQVKNKMKFSYPGYNETLTGAPDDRRIRSNKGIENPNPTVFEWLNKKASFSGEVAAFGAWEVFKGIFDAKKCGFLVSAGYEPLRDAKQTPELALLNALKKSTPRIWEDEPFDALPFYTALEYMKVNKPRVVFIGLGETDDWAHMGAYPEYLNAAHRDDEYLRQLWTLVQSTPEYRDQTTLIVLPDHGRSNDLFWRLHGGPFPGSGNTWMAFMGPDTPPLGEREMTATVTESQIAATVAALLGEDYKSDFAKAGKPIADVLSGAFATAPGAPTSESRESVGEAQ